VSAGGDISSETAETIAPDGSVTYNFNGHIAATGVDIVADTADLTTPQFTKPSEAQGANSVRWLRASDGAMVAQAAGSRATRLYHGANVELSEAALAAIDPAAVGGYAEAMLLAARNPDLQNRLQEWAALLARAHDDPGTGSVDAGYPGLFVEAGQLVGGALNESSTLLWDYLGHSDFAMRAAYASINVGAVGLAPGAVSAATATVIVQLPGVHFDGSLFNAEYFCPIVWTGGANNAITLALFVDGGLFANLTQLVDQGAGMQVPAKVDADLQPVQGIHTIDVRAWQSINGGGAQCFNNNRLKLRRA
jgi:hypothetical protein